MDTLIKTPEEFEKTVNYLNNEFEIKYLRKINFCLNLQIERNSSGILVHQSNYIVNVLKHFNMNNAQPPSTPMVVWSLNINKNPYHLKKEDEKVLILKYYT